MFTTKYTRNEEIQMGRDLKQPLDFYVFDQWELLIVIGKESCYFHSNWY